MRTVTSFVAAALCLSLGAASPAAEPANAAATTIKATSAAAAGGICPPTLSLGRQATSTLYAYTYSTRGSTVTTTYTTTYYSPIFTESYVQTYYSTGVPGTTTVTYTSTSTTPTTVIPPGATSTFVTTTCGFSAVLDEPQYTNRNVKTNTITQTEYGLPTYFSTVTATTSTTTSTATSTTYSGSYTQYNWIGVNSIITKTSTYAPAASTALASYQACGTNNVVGVTPKGNGIRFAEGRTGLYDITYTMGVFSNNGYDCCARCFAMPKLCAASWYNSYIAQNNPGQPTCTLLLLNLTATTPYPNGPVPVCDQSKIYGHAGGADVFPDLTGTGQGGVPGPGILQVSNGPCGQVFVEIDNTPVIFG